MSGIVEIHVRVAQGVQPQHAAGRPLLVDLHPGAVVGGFGVTWSLHHGQRSPGEQRSDGS